MSMPEDFLILDTEGKADQLSEIAIVNHHGQLVYEAFVQGHINNDERRINVKPLPNILAEFLTLVQNKLIVCHFAEHDINVLKQSFQRANLVWPKLVFACSVELAKMRFPRLPSYSLEYLSKHLNLKVEKNYFNPNFAHAARYDAAFTYQLYLTLRPPLTMQTTLQEKLQNLPNPFGTSRVDTPFQNHLDLPKIYQREFELLKSVLRDIKLDSNHQSKGAVVIGEAGSGKTHLMMRLAKELLQSNRLLFIRQPNHPEAVLYHTYSRILESFVELIPGTFYSQIEYLLAKSFSKIVIEILTKKTSLTKREENILQALSHDALNIYKVLGSENSEKKREKWQVIERITLDWWAKTHGFSGYTASLVKGLIKFCSYSDPHRREKVRRWLAGNELESEDLDTIGLDNWTEELSKEEFSLQALTVFGKLSLADEPLIIIFDQLEGLKSQEHLLWNFGEAIKELFTHVPNSLIILNLFPDRWEHFQQFFNAAVIDRVSQHQVILKLPPAENLRDILALRLHTVEVKLTELFTAEELQTILNASSIRGVLNGASSYYRHKVHGAPLSTQRVISADENVVATPRLSDDFASEIRTAIKQLQEDVALLKMAIQGQTSATLAPVEPPVTDKVSPINPPVNEEENLIIDYLQQQREVLEQEYEKKVIIADSDDLGKLLTIADAFKHVRQFETDYLRLGKKKLPEHLLIKTATQNFVIGFLQCEGAAFTSRLKNFNELVISYKDIRFGLFRDLRLPAITGKVGKDEVEKLNNSPNGKFRPLERGERINFELMYKLIVGVQNRDLEVSLKLALDTLESDLKDYWLIKIFQKGAHVQ